MITKRTQYNNRHNNKINALHENRIIESETGFNSDGTTPKKKLETLIFSTNFWIFLCC